MTGRGQNGTIGQNCMQPRKNQDIPRKRRLGSEKRWHGVLARVGRRCSFPKVYEIDKAASPARLISFYLVLFHRYEASWLVSFQASLALCSRSSLRLIDFSDKSDYGGNIIFPGLWKLEPRRWGRVSHPCCSPCAFDERRLARLSFR